MTMSVILLFLCSVLWLHSTALGKELTIVCVGSEDCVLPCRFVSDGKGARIMWYKKKAVVSCTRYGNTSFVVGHNSPAQKYVGRTGLYADQVLEGNATLVLRNVTPADQGKYICVTMTAPITDESGVISLEVKTPIRDVDIEFNDDAVVCRANGIFPPPVVTWSTDPPTDPKTLRIRTTSQKDRFGFYHVQSSLLLTGNNRTANQISNHTYICSVCGEDNKKTAFLSLQETISAYPGRNVVIRCILPTRVLQSFNMTWRYSRSDTIVTINVTDLRSQVQVEDQWKAHVFASLSATTSLHVRDMTAKIAGTYTCEVSTPAETYITWTVVTVKDRKEGIYITVIVLLCSAFTFSYAMLAWKIWKARGTNQANPNPSPSAGTMMTTTIHGVVEVPGPDHGENNDC